LRVPLESLPEDLTHARRAVCVIGLAVLSVLPIQAQTPGSLLDRSARLAIRDVPLEKALVLLQRSSGVSLVFSPDLLPRDRLVSCDCRTRSVAQALDQLLRDTELKYRLADRKVVIGRWNRREALRCGQVANCSMSDTARPTPSSARMPSASARALVRIPVSAHAS
jgi:hypothetical protein